MAPPPEPGTAEAEPAKPEPAAAQQGRSPLRPGQRILLGEMCPTGAAGRPSLTPVLLRGVQWTDDAGELATAISHGEAHKVAVFGVDGKRVGVFEPLGLADGAIPVMAAGSYAGAGPCTRLGPSGARLEEPTCQAATRGCGVAVAALGERAEGLTWRPSGACASGDLLSVDTDGDGVAESFPISGLLDGVRGPADAVDAAVGAAACTPTFSVFGLRVAPAPDPGKAQDPRYTVTIDVLAVLDLDDDGRVELVLGLRYPDQRTIAVYGAREQPSTLHLLGESSSWTR